MHQKPLLVFCLVFSLSFACRAQKKLKAGDLIPTFSLQSIFSEEIKSSGLKGKKTLITFNRYVSCPLCNFRTHELLSIYDSIKTTLNIISVYESSKETLTEYTKKEDIPFVMIADPEENMYTLFHVKKSWLKTFTGLFNNYKEKHSSGKKLFKSKYKRDGNLNRIGADFLVDENGIIQTAYYGKFVGDHLSISVIKKWVIRE